MKKLFLKFLKKRGYELKKITDDDFYPREATKADREIINYVLNLRNDKRNKLTMISPKCLWAAISSVTYCVENNLQGDIVECGVWRGGCSMAMALKLKEYKSEKKVWMFDTYEGMTEPTKEDIHHSMGVNAKDKYKRNKKNTHNDWCYASVEEVKFNLKEAKVEQFAKIVKGDVNKTLNDKKNLPLSISLLRLDTDWYESTKKELEVLYPKLSNKGILLVDDYGHWKGSQKAVDEYFKDKKSFKNMMWVTDYAGRSFIKLSA